MASQQRAHLNGIVSPVPPAIWLGHAPHARQIDEVAETT